MFTHPITLLSGGLGDLLLFLDYTSPTRQAFPTTATGVIPGRTADNIWVFDEADTAVVDEIAALALPHPVTSPEYQKKAVGFYDGGDTYNKSCVGYPSGSTTSAATSAASLDYTTGSFAFLIVYRANSNGGGFTLNLMRKLPASSALGGYRLVVQINGTIRWQVYDDISFTFKDTTGASYGDGAWRAVLAICDRTNNTINIITPTESVTAAEPAGTVTSTGVFTLGGPTGTLNTVDMAYLAVFSGADAEGLGQADLDAFWTHATDPGTGGIFPQLTTYTRASLACPIVGNEVGFGDRVAKYGSGQFAHAHDSSFIHPSKLGALVEGSKTNLIVESENLAITTTWSGTGFDTYEDIAVTVNDIEAPDGTQTADLLRTSADESVIYQDIVTTIGTDYTFSSFVQGSAGKAARLVIYDQPSQTEIAAAEFVGDGEWSRKGTTATALSTTTRAMVVVSGTDNKLVDLSYERPIQQVFPTSATQVISGRTASAIWLCDETSGNLVDTVASKALVPTGNPLQNRNCVGFFNGADIYSKKGVEFEEGDAKSYTASDTTFLDVDGSTSIAVLVVFKNVVTPTSNRAFVGKSGGGGGFVMQVRSSNQVRVIVNDVDDADSDIPATTSGGTIETGEWNAVIYSLDRNSGNHFIYSTWGTPATTAITVGSIVGSNGFQIGQVDTVFAGPVQVAYVSVFLGADAEGITQTDLDTFWGHATDPSSPKLDTYTHNSLSSYLAGEEVGFGARVAKWGTDQFSMGWSTNFSHDTKLGAQIEGAKTNLVLYSEDVTQAGSWSPINVTVSGTKYNAPDGTLTADRIRADANDGYLYQAMTTVASQEYTGSWYITAPSGTVTGRIILHDTSIEVANSPFTATGGWEQISVAGAHGGTTTQLRLELDNSDDILDVWGAQLETDEKSSYITTTSTTATRAIIDVRITNTAGQKLKGSAGEIHAVIALNDDSPVADGYILHAKGADNADQRHFTVVAPGDLHLQVFDGAEASQGVADAATIATWSQEHIVRARWDSQSTAYTASHTEFGDVVLDGAVTDGTITSTWTAADGATTLYVGQSSVNTSHLNGLMSSLKVFDAAQPDTPVFTDGVHVWGVQFESGELSSYIPTTSTTATRAAIDMDLTNTSEQYMRIVKGEVRAIFSSTVEASSAERTIIDISSGTNADRVLLRTNADARAELLIWDNGTTLRQDINPGPLAIWDEQASVRLRWDSVLDVTGHVENADAIINAVRYAGSDLTWSATAAGTTIYIGQNSSNANQLNSILATVKIYKTPQGE